MPDTPPVKGEKVTIGQLLGLDALSLLKDRSYLVFIVSSMLICIPLAFTTKSPAEFLEHVELPRHHHVVTAKSPRSFS